MDEEVIEIVPDIPLISPSEDDNMCEDVPILMDNDVKINGTDNHVTYKEEILKSGLNDSDVEYFLRAYKNLEEVKYIRIHCTSCDRHLGSAPKDLHNRYQHPILKVILCGNCFQFYCSGEFEKGEDGSELYCRWCGEGGLVFCCTKCPFVFCKNCITRNLGRGTSRIIQNTENWICFACHPWQISRHRATYWAIQKYSAEMITLANNTGNTDILNEDSNICCAVVKKRTEVYDKLKEPVQKKPRVLKVPQEFPTLLQTALQKGTTPSTSKIKSKKSSKNWKDISILSSEPEDEVICTPDIFPIDDSPPNSPTTLIPVEPPALLPILVKPQSPVPIVATVQPEMPPASSTQINRNNVQKRFYKKIQPKPTTKLLKPNLHKIIPSSNNNYNTKAIHDTSKSSIVHIDLDENINKKDWFDKTVIECAEVTEYISTKISGLSDVHSRAYKSTRLMEELHNTLQTYVLVAIDKLRKIKQNMHLNFEQERKSKSGLLVNPFAKTKNTSFSNENSNSSFEQLNHSSVDEDSASNHSIKAINKPKRKYYISYVQPDEVPFDMDVTNASDEELNSPISNNSRATSVTPLDHGDLLKQEIINIISSSDEDEPDQVEIVKELPNKKVNTEIYDAIKLVKLKYNVDHISMKELLHLVSCKVILYNNKQSQKEFDKVASVKSRINNSFNLKERIETLINESHTETISDIIQDKTSSDNSTEVEPVKNNLDDHLENEDSESECDSDTKSKCNENDKNVVNYKCDNKEELPLEEHYDVEEMLGGSVVLRRNTSFGDEFSKFIGKSDLDESQCDNEEDDIFNIVANTSNVTNELDVDDLCLNKDNESLSLPPDGISDDLTGNRSILINDKNDTSDLVLDSGILALKQMAENCVNSTMELHATGTECTG